MEWLHDPAIPARSARTRLSVTKALTRDLNPITQSLAAARAGVALEPWQQLVADAAHGRTLVAVAGTHGKAHAGWLTWILAEAGVDPSAFVGALLPASPRGASRRPRSARAPFVVEADEYAGNFDPYFPNVAALTTVEWDHPDVFVDRAAVIASFERWLVSVPAAAVVANLADSGVVEVLGRLRDDPQRTGATIETLLAGAVRATSAARSRRSWSWTPGSPARWSSGRPTGSCSRSAAAPLRPAGSTFRPPGTTTPPTRWWPSQTHLPRSRPAGCVDRRPPHVGPRQLPGIGRRLEAQGRSSWRGGVRRLRPSPHRDPGHPRGRPPARAGATDLGGLQSADLPSDAAMLGEFAAALA